MEWLFQQTLSVSLVIKSEFPFGAIISPVRHWVTQERLGSYGLRSEVRRDCVPNRNELGKKMQSVAV